MLTTLHKYLYGHIRSSFLRIDAPEISTAVYLPVQQFKKQPQQRYGVEVEEEFKVAKIMVEVLIVKQDVLRRYKRSSRT